MYKSTKRMALIHVQVMTVVDAALRTFYRNHCSLESNHYCIHNDLSGETVAAMAKEDKIAQKVDESQTVCAGLVILEVCELADNQSVGIPEHRLVMPVDTDMNSQ
jgi:hypothetical protein